MDSNVFSVYRLYICLMIIFFLTVKMNTFAAKIFKGFAPEKFWIPDKKKIVFQARGYLHAVLLKYFMFLRS